MRAKPSTAALAAYSTLLRPRSTTTSPLRRLSSRPYICATCLLSSTTTSSSPPSSFPSPIRLLSSSASSPSPPTHYTFFPESFPSGAPPSSRFLPDLRKLRREYLHLQTRTHPDRFPTSEKAAAEARSAAISEAYRTLADPLRHANYLLAQHGLDTEDESAKMEDAALLMEVMEAREMVDEAESEGEVARLRGENDGRVGDSVARLERLVEGGEWEEAGREAVKLRYWRNVGESIEGWEEGRGGGAVHH